MVLISRFIGIIIFGFILIQTGYTQMDHEQTKDGQNDTTYVHMCKLGRAQLESSLSGITGHWSPGDHINDVFYVSGPGLSDFDLSIYNRLGALVFRTQSPQEGWDGTYKNVLQPSNVYVYNLNATCPDGSVITKKGYVTLL